MSTAPPRPHPHVPDVSVGRDFRGQTFCAVCHLPRGNRAHDYIPPPDLGARILGERHDLEDEEHGS